MRTNPFSLLFPATCLRCSRPGSEFCEDCLSTLSVIPTSFAPGDGLDGCSCALSLEEYWASKLVSSFTKEPFLKGLGPHLAFLIIQHLQGAGNESVIEGASLLAVPDNKGETRKHGYHPAALLVQELSRVLRVPVKTSSRVLLVDVVYGPAVHETARRLKQQGVDGVWALLAAR